MTLTGWNMDASEQVACRWREIDPLLPVPEFSAQSCGWELVVGRPDGRATAAGRCEHWVGAAGSLDLSWGTRRRFQLTAQVAGPDVGHDLDQMLAGWRGHLAEVAGAGEPDTSAIVNWPNRDIDGVAALLRHGLLPLEVIAARTAPGEQANQGSSGRKDELLIRRAGSDDVDAVVRLGLEVIRFDSHFGTVNERPGTAAALRAEAAASLLADPAAWTWLAERDGNAVGLLAAQRPTAATWIAPMVRIAPAAYLMLMFVQPGERGGGIGAALTQRFHNEIDSTDVAVTLLHYEQLNPFSVPFWHRHGYRPLWTSWQVTPARAIR